MLELTTSTEIDASAETVWQVLTDLPRFADWNPFIREAHGTPAVGATLRVRVESSVLPVRLAFRPEILECDRPYLLRWRGCFLAAWLGRGEHTFAIEPIRDGRVRFVQRETFGGLLPRLGGRLLEREARRGFDAMNQALKERAEAARSAPARAPCAPSAGAVA